MVRRLRSAVAYTLSLALVALNPGWAASAPVLKAQVGHAPQGRTALVGNIPQLTISPIVPLASQLKLGQPPVLGQTFSLPQLSQDVAPQIQAIHDAGASVEGAFGAGSNIQALLEGKTTGNKASFNDPVNGSESSYTPLFPSSRITLPELENDYDAYNTRRWNLKKLAAKAIVASVPKAGTKLTSRLIKEAGSRKVVILSLASKPEAELVQSIKAVSQAGKTVILAAEPAVLQSLETAPKPELAGVHVIVSDEEKTTVYRNDAEGRPEKVWEQRSAWKSAAVAWIASELKIKAGDAVLVGSALYAPNVAPGEKALKAEAERLSGSPIPQTGSDADRVLEGGLPEMLTLSVTGTADPRMENAWALQGEPSGLTLKVLGEMAKPAVVEKPVPVLQKIGSVALFLGIAAGSLFFYYSFWKAFVDIASGNIPGPIDPNEIPFDGDWGDFFHTSGLSTLAKDIANFTLPGVGGGALLLGALMMKSDPMPTPSRDFKLALEQAVKAGAKYGYTEDQVYFGGATTSLPRRDGHEWSYSFYFSRDLQAGRVDLAYVDILTGWTVTPDFRVSYFPGVDAPKGLAAIRELSVEYGPEQALDAVRAAYPDFDSRVSLSISPEGEYTIYDGRGGQAVVDAQTNDVTLESVPAPYETSRWTTGKTVTLALFTAGFIAWLAPKLLWVAGLLLVVGILVKLIGMKSFVGGETPKAPGVADADIEKAAEGVISSKGRPWSQTEYNMGYYNTLENLKKRGATEEQLERFKKLCDDAPVKNGGFNPWSGD
jgi:hypothetical protein